MSEQKLPHNAKHKNSKKPKQELSIVADARKSALAKMNELGGLAIAQPQSGILGTSDLAKLANISTKVFNPLANSTFLKDIERTTSVINDFAKSAAFTRATEALTATQDVAHKLSTIALPAMEDMTRVAKIVAEPMERLSSSVVALNKIHNFDLSIQAITEVNDAISTKHWMEPTYEHIMVRPNPIQSTVMVLKERVDNLADEISEKVEQKFQEQFDNFIEKGIIPAGIKKANCHCIHCDKLLFKVEDMSHFMRGTLKCSCNETLQIPRDLKIVPNE